MFIVYVRRPHRHAVVMAEKMQEISKYIEKEERRNGWRMCVCGCVRGREREKKKKSRLFYNIRRQDEYYVHV